MGTSIHEALGVVHFGVLRCIAVVNGSEGLPGADCHRGLTQVRNEARPALRSSDPKIRGRQRHPAGRRMAIGALLAAYRPAPKEEPVMKWVTREHPKTDRIACPWLIRKFIDPEAQIVYVPRDEVLTYADREGAASFDAPGAKYTHRDGKCSFETLVEEYHIDDPAIALLAKVVHGADVSEDRDATPESRGLLAIADGFALLDLDDQRQLELELPVYDALYAWAQAQVG
jgi:hypothetical protein